MGYRPNYIAKGLRARKSNIIGIIADDITMGASNEIISSIMEVCEREGYHAMIQNLRFYSRWGSSWKDENGEYAAAFNEAFSELLAIKVDGIIMVAGHARQINVFPKNLSAPVVMAYGYTETEEIPCVVLDDETAGYEMTNYLISMGHKKIGVIGGEANNMHVQKRVLGYQRALYENGVPYNPDWIRYGKFSGWFGYEAAGKLIEDGVTAIFCLTDFIAGGVYRYLAENEMTAGKDISVAGFNNEGEWVELSIPGLTTMKLPLTEIGKETIRLLLEKIEGEETTRDKKVEVPIHCDFVFRDSVKEVG